MNSGMRWSIAFLALPPSRVFAGDGDLTKNHLEFSQDSAMWSMYYYHHSNAFTLGTNTYAVSPGDVAFIPPGSSCGHAAVGEGYWCDFFRFDLPAASGIRAAIPHVVRDQKWQFENLRKASNKIIDAPAPTQAFIWNFLWMVSQSLTLFRDNDELYIAEEFIRQNLGRKFSVDELAEFCQVSSRTLLKLFRAEHGVTIQEYVLQMRAKEAARLLLKSDRPIKEIAIQVGMPDLQYFNKTMRSMTGRAPSRIRADRDLRDPRA